MLSWLAEKLSGGRNQTNLNRNRPTFNRSTSCPNPNRNAFKEYGIGPYSQKQGITPQESGINILKEVSHCWRVKIQMLELLLNILKFLKTKKMKGYRGQRIETRQNETKIIKEIVHLVQDHQYVQNHL